MNCKQIERQLIYYLDDNLHDNIKREISDHLNSCSECKEKLVFIQDSLQLLDKEMITEVKPFLYSRLKERINNQKSHQLPQRYLIPLAAASILTFGFFIGSVLGSYTISQAEELVYNEFSVETLFNDSVLEIAENILLNE